VRAGETAAPDQRGSGGGATSTQPRSPRRLRSVLARVSRRGLAVTMLFLLPAVGAAVGAALRTAPSSRYQAVATLVPPASTGGSARAATSQLLADLVNDGAAPAEFGSSGAGGGQGRVSASVRSGGGLAIRVRASSTAIAKSAANSVSSQLISLGALIHGGAGTSGLVLGDFSRGLDGWGGQSLFSTAPRALRIGHRDARFGISDLVIHCQSAPGCGAAHSIPYLLQPNRYYKATVWVRAVDGPLRISLVLGRDPHDYAASEPVEVTKAWKRVTITWQPRTLGPGGELDVQRAGGAGTALAVGAATLTVSALSQTKALASLTPARQRRLLATMSSFTLMPAVANGTVSVSTPLWVVGGALAGLLLAVVGIASGSAAARRDR